MATTYAGEVKVQIKSKVVNALDLSTVSDILSDPALSIVQALADGTGSGKAQVHWHDRRSLEATGGADTDALDLAGGVVNAFGTVTFTKIKAILIKMVTATTGLALEIGAGSDPITSLWGASGDVAILGAGGIFLMTSPVDGFALTGGSADKLTITNPSAAAITYDIVVIGEGTIA